MIGSWSRLQSVVPFLTVAALGLFAAASAGAQDAVISANLAANPSFEQAAAEARLPEAWSGDTAVYSVGRDVVHSGSVALKYVNADANRYRLAGQKLDLKPGWKYRISVWVKTEGLEGKESGATICLEWRGKDGKFMGGLYPSGVKGTTDWTHVEGATRIPEGATAFSLACYVRNKMTGTAWFDDVEVVRVADQPLQSVLVEPAYRGRITAEGPKTIRVHLGLNLADYESLKPDELSVATQLTNASGQTVSFKGDPASEPVVEKGVFAKGAEAELSYPADALPAGQYQLTVRLLGPDAKEMQAISHAIVRTPDDFRPRCAIDSHRRVILDGKPFFPLGMYWGGIKEDELKVFAASKFNCLMAYGSPSREQMDLAERYGIKVIYSIKDWYFGHGGCRKDIRSIADEEPKIRERVREFRNHPALLAWYLNDELPQSFMEQLNAHQRFVAEEDPDHPTWVVLYQYREVGDYIHSFDAIGTDPYPIGRRPASEAGMWTAETRRQVRDSKPVWQVPQVFNWANYHKDDAKPEYRTPTLDEMRSMAWQCITEGANGLVFYSWFDIRRNPDVPFDTQWERLRTIAEEIDRFAPILLSADPVPMLTVEAPAWLHWTARVRDGKLYVFAVNDGDGEGKVRFKFPAAPKAVRAVLDGRSIAVAGDTLEDELKPLALAVYEVEL
jgi:hypothetical protein